MLIDFTEIPESNGEGIKQDIFEKFCRDFLQAIGYKIISDPARGADGGIDVLAEEIRAGIGGTTKVRWLVSCKHYAHSAKSITKSIEQDIRDRVESHDCDGFIGFYTTIAGRSLLNNLESLSGKLQFQIFDNEKIERHLIGDTKYKNIMMGYFPESYKKWHSLYYYQEPTKLLESYIKSIKNSDYVKSFALEGLIKIFGSTAVAIKQTRTNISLSQALECENINYIVIDEFSESMFQKTYPQIFKFVGEAISKLNLDPAMARKYREFSMGRYGQINYLLYSSRILVGPEYDLELSDAFRDLKDLLT